MLKLNVTLSKLASVLFFPVICMSSLALFASLCVAVEVEGLYQSEQTVTSRSSALEKKALSQGLAEVIVRVHGNRSALKHSKIRQQLKRAKSFVQRFEYREQKVPANEMGEAEQSQLLLRITFHPGAVNQLLDQVGLSRVGHNRPLTLAWLAVEGEQGRQLLSASTQHEMAQLLKQVAKLRGVPLIFPLLDLEDTLQVSISDVWGQFEGPIKQGSLRYAADAIMAGRISMDEEEQWFGRWFFTIKNKTIHWEVAEGSLEQAISQVIDFIANQLGARYGIMANADEQNQPIIIEVANVKSLADYAQLFAYLKSLALMSELEVQELAPTKVIFKANIRSDMGALVTVLGFDAQLSLLKRDQRYLSYKWTP